MTTLVICNCGRVQEYDVDLVLSCTHCDEVITHPEIEEGYEL